MSASPPDEPPDPEFEASIERLAGRPCNPADSEARRAQIIGEVIRAQYRNALEAGKASGEELRLRRVLARIPMPAHESSWRSLAWSPAIAAAVAGVTVGVFGTLFASSGIHPDIGRVEREPAYSELKSLDLTEAVTRYRIHTKDAMRSARAITQALTEAHIAYTIKFVDGQPAIYIPSSPPGSDATPPVLAKAGVTIDRSATTQISIEPDRP